MSLKCYSPLLHVLVGLLVASAAPTGHGSRGPGSPELDPTVATAVLTGISLSTVIPDAWTGLFEVAAPFSTNIVARVVLCTRFDVLLRTQSGLAGTVPAHDACVLWGRAAVNALDFLALYTRWTGVRLEAPYGQEGIKRRDAQMAYQNSCEQVVPPSTMGLDADARDDIRFIMTRKLFL